MLSVDGFREETSSNTGAVMNPTEDEIRNMPAGREMDTLVAKYVMGFMVEDGCSPNLGKNSCVVRDWEGAIYYCLDVDRADALRHAAPGYSTDIAATWKVIEAMANLKPYGAWCQIRSPWGKPENDIDNLYWVGFTPHLTTGWNGIPDCLASAPIAPLAICRASLLKVFGYGP